MEKDSKGSRFRVEGPLSDRDLLRLYPHAEQDQHTHKDINAAVEDLLAARSTEGWDIIDVDRDYNGHWRFVFRAT